MRDKLKQIDDIILQQQKAVSAAKLQKDKDKIVYLAYEEQEKIKKKITWFYAWYDNYDVVEITNYKGEFKGVSSFGPYYGGGSHRKYQVLKKELRQSEKTYQWLDSICNRAERLRDAEYEQYVNSQMDKMIHKNCFCRDLSHAEFTRILFDNKGA